MTCMPKVAFSGLFCNHALQKALAIVLWCLYSCVPGHTVFDMYVDQTLSLFYVGDYFFFFNETGKPRNYIPFEASASHLRERPYLLPLTLTCSLGVRR